MFEKYKALFISLFVVLFICLLAFVYLLFKKTIIFNVPNDFLNTVDVGEDFTVPSITACYGNRFKCDDITVSVDSNVDVNVIGNYKIKYTANYMKKSKTIEKDISVVDRVVPEIITDIDELSVCPGATDFEFDYKAYDNYDGDLSGSVIKEVIDDTLTLSVSDSSNNLASKSVLLKHEDLEAPSISLNGNRNMYIPINSSFSDPGYEAYDNCDGNITDRVSVNGSVDTSKAGSYTITYSVTDNLGNDYSTSRSVSVYAPNSDGSKVVYLTFDDGPSQYTGELLNILAKYNVKATFFVTNINSNYSYYIKQAHEQGHSIALHTSSHNYSKVILVLMLIFLI